MTIHSMTITNGKKPFIFIYKSSINDVTILISLWFVSLILKLYLFLENILTLNIYIYLFIYWSTTSSGFECKIIE
jgi:hypothetical protein